MFQNIITKTCTRCKHEKEAFPKNFPKQKNGKLGLKSWCKLCVKEFSKTHYLKNRVNRLKQTKRYRKLHRKRYIFLSKRWYIKNKQYCKLYNQNRYKNNKKTILLRNKKYLLKNKNKRNEYLRLYLRKRRNNDIGFKIKSNLSRRINYALKAKKSKKTLEFLGCSIQQFKKYLESKFKPNMSWKNYGMFGWHIDHIRPCASFNLSDPEQQKQCFHYTNLQPLWAKENLSKSNKII